MWLYHKDDEWVECKLLHEFLEAYQIQYTDSMGQAVETVVKREAVHDSNALLSH